MHGFSALHGLVALASDLAAAAPSPGDIAPRTIPTIDVHHVALHCVADCGDQFSPGNVMMSALVLLSPVSALIYGFGYASRPPSAFRTAVKVLPVGSLAVLAAIIAFMDHQWMGPSAELWAPLILAAAFLLCAAGDGFLAGDPKRWLPPGLATFLLGHVCFIGLFATALVTGRAAVPGPVTSAGIAAVIAAGLAMLAWLWPSLGKLRPAVVAYIGVIVAMVCLGLVGAASHQAWAIGGLLFMASDAILAVQLFKDRDLLVSKRLTGWAIWFLYYAAQVFFLLGLG
jgi:uncharacterized membrane protein YhhN